MQMQGLSLAGHGLDHHSVTWRHKPIVRTPVYIAGAKKHMTLNMVDDISPIEHFISMNHGKQHPHVGLFKTYFVRVNLPFIMPLIHRKGYQP